MAILIDHVVKVVQSLALRNEKDEQSYQEHFVKRLMVISNASHEECEIALRDLLDADIIKPLFGSNIMNPVNTCVFYCADYIEVIGTINNYKESDNSSGLDTFMSEEPALVHEFLYKLFHNKTVEEVLDLCEMCADSIFD